MCFCTAMLMQPLESVVQKYPAINIKDRFKHLVSILRWFSMIAVNSHQLHMLLL